MARRIPAVLPTTYVVLRILIILNWLMGLAILALLVAMPNERWIMSAFDLTPGPDADRLVLGLRVVAVLGLVSIPIHYLILKRLVAMVETVGAGDPFVAINARRLRTIGWSLLMLQLMSIVIGRIAKAVSTPAHPVNLDAGFSASGWLAVLLTFVLAYIFAEGAKMRDELEGTV